MLCLARDEDDLRARIDRMLVAFTDDGEPVTAEELGATGAMLALLRDALWPNLVQTARGHAGARARRARSRTSRTAATA